jgi:hypothetical protein
MNVTDGIGKCFQKSQSADGRLFNHCDATMRIIALIDDAEVIERVPRLAAVRDPPPEPRSATGPDPPVPKGETLPFADHPVPDIA